MPAHSYDYCDKNPETKDPKGHDERAAKRKVKQDKRYGMEGQSSNKKSEITKLKATIATQNKLMAVNEAKNKAVEMEPEKNHHR